VKRPLAVVLGVISVVAAVAGVALVGVFWHHIEGWGPPTSPWRHGMQECLVAPEELPPPVLENLDRMGPKERERALDFLGGLRPSQRRQVLRELERCPRAEFRDRLGGMMGEPPQPPFPWPVALLFLGSLGLAVTLYLAIRKRDSGARLERCPHCGRPVETGWSYCPYCTGDLRRGGDDPERP
jgi:hypothetical protein